MILVNIKKPECCDECVFMETQDSGWGNEYICSVSKEEICDDINCPIVEVPEQHGDLIDRDELLEYAFRYKFAGSSGSKVVFVSRIKDAPAIIPADHIGEGTEMIVKDCRTCRYGYVDDHWGIPSCHDRSGNCIDFSHWIKKERL